MTGPSGGTNRTVHSGGARIDFSCWTLFAQDIDALYISWSGAITFHSRSAVHAPAVEAIQSVDTNMPAQEHAFSFESQCVQSAALALCAKDSMSCGAGADLLAE